jgi:hypothetical protein
MAKRLKKLPAKTGKRKTVQENVPRRKSLNVPTGRRVR